MSPKKIFLLCACLALMACTKVEDSTSNALDTVGNETSATYNKTRDLLDIGHKPKPPTTKEAQARYCYKTYEDIICYAKPLPGEEYRLVGFQTAAGKTGYTMPPTVPASDVDKPLAPLKSVNVPTLPPTKGQDDKQLKEIIFDPSELEPKQLVPDKQQ